MATSQPHRQTEIAQTLEQTARTLAHSTRDVPAPFDSYRLLGELAPTVDHLEQVCRQLGEWHRQAIDGQHYAGEDERGDGATGTIEAAVELECRRGGTRAGRQLPPRRPRGQQCPPLDRRLTHRPRCSTLDCWRLRL